MADEAGAAVFDPKGKAFSLRVDAFIADVKANYKIVVTKDHGRTAEWQQKHHVCHMFAYNKYKSTTPRSTDKGERTISWDHIIDPKVTWSLVSWTDLLRTKTGSTPVRQGDGWAKNAEPDKEKSLENCKQILKDAGIGNAGQAMVSSGTSPCGEPCGCGAGRSNHLSDAAADLSSSGLTQLKQALAKLEKEKATDLDTYMAKFGLHRPLKDHPESPEEWHVEALPEN